MIKLSDTTTIIKKLHVYWDNDNGMELVDQVLSEYRKNNPDYEINLMNKDTIKNFLKTRYTTLYQYFDLFKVYCIRSDIARLVYLYIYGGFYCDLHVSVGDMNLVNIRQSNILYSDSKSFLGDRLIRYMYSSKEDDLLLKCLDICEYKVKKIIESGLTDPGQYCKEICVAAGNGLYHYHKLDKSMCSNEDPYTVANYFGDLIGDNIFRSYQSAIFTANNTRGNNKHWSNLCKEISLI